MSRTSETVRVSGRQFHHYLVVRDLRPDDVGKTGHVWCRCVPCGQERSVLVESLLRGTARGCRSCVRLLPTGATSAARQADTRARRRGDGLCDRCGSAPVEGAKRCRTCLEKERERYRAKRGSVRVLRCRICNGVGHNVLTCTAAPAAAGAAS